MVALRLHGLVCWIDLGPRCTPHLAAYPSQLNTGTPSLKTVRGEQNNSEARCAVQAFLIAERAGCTKCLYQQSWGDARWKRSGLPHAPVRHCKGLSSPHKALFLQVKQWRGTGIGYWGHRGEQHEAPLTCWEQILRIPGFDSEDSKVLIWNQCTSPKPGRRRERKCRGIRANKGTLTHMSGPQTMILRRNLPPPSSSPFIFLPIHLNDWNINVYVYFSKQVHCLVLEGLLLQTTATAMLYIYILS